MKKKCFIGFLQLSLNLFKVRINFFHFLTPHLVLNNYLNFNLIINFRNSYNLFINLQKKILNNL